MKNERYIVDGAPFTAIKERRLNQYLEMQLFSIGMVENKWRNWIFVLHKPSSLIRLNSESTERVEIVQLQKEYPTKKVPLD